MEDKLEDLEILGINGLDAAAVGTAMVGGEAVLVYDYDKCVELIIAAGNEVDYAEDYLLEVASLLNDNYSDRLASTILAG